MVTPMDLWAAVTCPSGIRRTAEDPANTMDLPSWLMRMLRKAETCEWNCYRSRSFQN